MAKKKRTGISQKIRFEVFKRDNFKCQYCGQGAPEVLLEIDHIDPVANDGPESILNYLTSCQDCNRGKGARHISDSAEVSKQRAQLEELNERRNQLEQLLRWRQSLQDLEGIAAAAAVKRIDEILSEFDHHLNDRGLADVRSWVKRFGIEHVLTGVETANLAVKVARKEDFPQDFLDLIPRIARTRKLSEKRPYLQDIYYIRGILRRRLEHLDQTHCLIFLEQAIGWGADPDVMKDFARQCSTWSQFRSWVRDEWEPL